MSITPESDAVAIAGDAPCGQDLFNDGDSAFMNFIVKAEGLLPASFFSKIDGAPFDRNSVDLSGEAKAGEALSARTHDIRLLALVTKLHALNRDPYNVARLLQRIATHLASYWEHIHPCAEQGDFAYRMACLQALDDNTHVVLPLQHAAILKHPRIGDISLRSILIATGQLEPRENETRSAASDLERAIAEIDLRDVRAARDVFALISDCVASIRATWLDRAGYDQAVRFDLVAPFATKARDAIAAYVAQRDAAADARSGDGKSGDASASAAFTEHGSPAPSGHTGAVRSFADAEQALWAAAEFFARNEPSNPALPLIRQAQQLMGKSFVDVLRILAPTHVDAAFMTIGKGPFLQFPVERLAEFSALPETTPASDAATTFVANSRHEAVGILAAVSAFYAKHEPSSPLPLFVERATSLSGRDFLAIIKDVLPEDALKVVERNLP